MPSDMQAVGEVPASPNRREPMVTHNCRVAGRF